MRLIPTEEQQDEMRHAYYDGAPGILISGLVWLTAALVCYQLGINKAVWTLLIGGALIHPIGIIVTKALGRPAKTANANALNQLVMASTIWLILCCVMAYGLFLLKPDLFFPAMMATIGSRYLLFASVFGRPDFLGAWGDPYHRCKSRLLFSALAYRCSWARRSYRSCVCVLGVFKSIQACGLTIRK